MTYRDLLRMKRELEERERDESVPERREKRNEDDSRCSSEVTTLTVGCSTADRMEFQSDCVDAITAYSCHGRWFDAEGTQFVIATPLARRTAWSNSESNNRAQPYRNSRRLCFMYKESGGVVSLTASPIACQRGIPPPTPMLAFNATSTGQCMETNGGQISRSTYLTIALLMVAVAIFRSAVSDESVHNLQNDVKTHFSRTHCTRLISPQCGCGFETDVNTEQGLEHHV
ncbi:hypothetical protein EAG_07231 [Camponotus floridanus]|uniref:Uncharacterized protein n=1 Tax=Camponotus floridanus TaxID=104421 RepID=E2AMM8_CAMFO|nr:hypothetical protein EAG_07231 [Camponotus floridanus]